MSITFNCNLHWLIIMRILIGHMLHTCIPTLMQFLHLFHHTGVRLHLHNLPIVPLLILDVYKGSNLLYITLFLHICTPTIRNPYYGTAGTGKSYLINCLKLLLQHHPCVSVPTGVASFNIEGVTLYSLFSLPTRGGS